MPGRARQITGVRCGTEPYDRFVFLLSPAQELRQSRRTAHQNDKHAGCERIESTGVTHPPLADDLSHAGDHVMRSHAGGLVDYERTIHVDHCSLCVPPCPLWLNTISLPQSTQRKTNTRKTRRYKALEEEPGLDAAKARERVFARAGKLLAAKPRSIAELRERLLEGRGATRPVVDEAIERLREYGYLDDAKFAQNYASLRVQQQPVGRQRLQRDLWLKKVDKATADAALDQVFEETSEADLIDRAIAKRLRLRGRPKTREQAKKLFDHLLRQGFGFELVSERVRALSKDDTEDE